MEVTHHAGAVNAKPVYVTPVIKVMSEDEVLAKFQLTSAMMAWWVMGVGGSG